MTQITGTQPFLLLVDGAGFDPIEDRLRANARVTIERCSRRSGPHFSGAFAMAGATARRSKEFLKWPAPGKVLIPEVGFQARLAPASFVRASCDLPG